MGSDVRIVAEFPDRAPVVLTELSEDAPPPKQAGDMHTPAHKRDRSFTVYRGFFHIACYMIVLRRVLQ